MKSLFLKILKALTNRYHLLQSIFNQKKIRFYNGIIGTGCYLPGIMSVKIEDGGKVSIGNNVTILSGPNLNPLSRNMYSSLYCERSASITIGHYVGISSASIWAKSQILIGDYVNIGANTIIIDNDAHSLNAEIRRDRDINEYKKTKDQENASTKPIHIESDVLIGANCIVLKGVSIGARSVIGAGSVVTSSIPADCIAAGNPCRVIKYCKDHEYYKEI